MLKRRVLMVLAVAAWIACAGGAEAYQAVAVRDGGTVKGTVRVRGAVPSDQTIVPDKDVEYCGKALRAGEYLVSGSRVQNVVVWIDGIQRGKPLPDNAVAVTLRKCRAEPRVSVGFVGGKYLFENDDDILHTLQLKLGLAYQKKVSSRPLEDGATIYNLALPVKGLRIEKPIRRFHRYDPSTGFIQVRSNTHDWIRGYIFVFDQPYAAVTDANGSFAMEDVPPGTYVLKAWHEGFGVTERKVTVRPGGTAEVEITFAAPGGVSVESPWWGATAAEASERGGRPVLEVEEPSYGFGTVAQGTVVRHDFRILNRGDAVLKVLDLVPSCSECTSASARPAEIAPGASGIIAVTLDTRDESGRVRKDVEVRTNAPERSRVILSLHGTVRASGAPAAGESEPGSGSAWVTETRYDFGTIRQGRVVHHAFEVVNKGSGVLRIRDLVPA